MSADQGCALYRHFAADGSLLYVGISLSALNRLGQHKQNAEWFDKISRPHATSDQQNAQARRPAGTVHWLSGGMDRPQGIGGRAS